MNKQASSDILKKFRAYRFSYMIGKPIVDDETYENIRLCIEKSMPDTKELSQVYEDDVIDIDELVAFGVDERDINSYISKPKVTPTSEFNKGVQLIEEDNKSIVSKRTEAECLASFRSLGYGTYFVSPKIDGIFVSTIYRIVREGVYELYACRSRGSVSNSVDLKGTLGCMVPKEIYSKNINSEFVKFSYEAIMNKTELGNNGYTSQRSGAQGVLMSTVDIKCDKFKDIILYMHGVSEYETFEDKYNLIKEISDSSIPFKMLTINCEEDYFKAYEDAILFVREFSETTGVDVDGVVVKKDRSTVKGEQISGYKLYDADVFAIKSGFWDKEDYVVKVINFISEYSSSEISYGIVFNPIVVSNGNTMTRVTNIRLSTLVDNNILPGDYIKVSYDNGTTPRFKGKVVEEDDTGRENIS